MNSALSLHPKVAAAGLSGSLALVIIWAFGLAHVTVDPVVAGAIATILSFAGGYLAPILQKEKTVAAKPAA